jgi:hypothetical protein
MAGLLEGPEGEDLEMTRGKGKAKSDVGVPLRLATAEGGVKPADAKAEAAESALAEAPKAATAEAGSAGPKKASGMGPRKIRSLWPATIKIVGPSGTRYEWPRAGSVAIVNFEDVAFVMGKNREDVASAVRKNRNEGRACCGGSSARIYFEPA